MVVKAPWQRTSFVTVIAFACACSSSFARPTPEQTSLLEAVMLIMMGFEQGLLLPAAKNPLEFVINDDGVSYVLKEFTPPRASQSYSLTAKINSPSNCIFNLQIETDSPLGPGSLRLDLTQMTHIEAARYHVPNLAFPIVLLEGTNVYCENDKCRNKRQFNLDGGPNTDAAQIAKLAKVRDAVSLVKKACPLSGVSTNK